LGKAVLPNKLEDKDVGPAIGIDEEILETGPDTGEPKFATDVGGGAAVTVGMVVGTSVGVEIVGVEMVGVDVVGEIGETGEPGVVEVGGLTEGSEPVGEESVLRVGVVSVWRGDEVMLLAAVVRGDIVFEIVDGAV
jgi:hypothetical protein